jgi:hypothetical protein
MGEGCAALASLFGELRRSWERVTPVEDNRQRCHPLQLRLGSFVAKATYPLPSKGEGLKRNSLAIQRLTSNHKSGTWLTHGRSPQTPADLARSRAGMALVAAFLPRGGMLASMVTLIF